MSQATSWTSETFKEQTLVHEVAWLKGRTPYELLRDYPFWVAALFSVYAAFAKRRKGAAPASAV